MISEQLLEIDLNAEVSLVRRCAFVTSIIAKITNSSSFGMWRSGDVGSRCRICTMVSTMRRSSLGALACVSTCHTNGGSTPRGQSNQSSRVESSQ